MSTGGIFKIITNDGKQDRLLMATELLNARLTKIRNQRKSFNKDSTPTLLDIEKTHILFFNAHYKPFAAMGYEYNKVAPSTGTVALDSAVRFSIPQFGDLFNDMALHIKLSDPVPTGGTTPTYRWCDYIGERLCKKTTFTVNGNMLDEYFSHDYTFHRNFKVQAHKVEGYNRCVGQENLMNAEIYQSSIAPINARSFSKFANGFQTPKTSHGSVELFIPLLFWFNLDPRLSIPSVSIPFGQRFIEIELAAQEQLVGLEARGNSVTSGATMGTVTIQKCELYINNIFMNPEIHDIFIKRIGFTLIRVHRRQVTRLSVEKGEVHLNSFKWPIESFSVGFRPIENQKTTNVDYDGNASGVGAGVNHLDHWHYFSRVTRTDQTGLPMTLYTDTQSHTIATISVKAHGISIYEEFPGPFFSSYIPFTFGTLCTANDIGCYKVVFNLHPGVYQPSGHINVSRAREFYLGYDSSTLDTVISTTRPVDMIANGDAINFMLVSDGSAVLRYST